MSVNSECAVAQQLQAHGTATNKSGRLLVLAYTLECPFSSCHASGSLRKSLKPAQQCGNDGTGAENCSMPRDHRHSALYAPHGGPLKDRVSHVLPPAWRALARDLLVRCQVEIALLSVLRRPERAQRHAIWGYSCGSWPSESPLQ